MKAALRSEIWLVEFDPVRGHEQGGSRPALVVSNDVFNASAADLIVVVPITSKGRTIRSFLKIEPADTGLKLTSYIICDQVRTVSKDRLKGKLGALPQPVMAEVKERLKYLLDLG